MRRLDDAPGGGYAGLVRSSKLMRSLLPLLILPALAAQTARKPFQAQSVSSIAFSVQNGEEAVEIVNSTYEAAGPGIPGRPAEDLQVLRTTTRTKQVIGDIGVEATTTVEAWPLGVDLKQKPRYSVTVAATGCQTIDHALLSFSRGLEETGWWSIYKLGTGTPLFDTYVPLVRFSIARQTETLRYAGLEVPPDNTADARMKDPHVVAVITYASAERVIREALVTADDPHEAAQLRSFADETREMSIEQRGPALSLKISFSHSYPFAPATVTLRIPIVRDDLGLAQIENAASIHVAAWKR
jgi:hypothetical protein